MAQKVLGGLLGLLFACAASAETLNYDYVYASHQESEQDNQSTAENDVYGGYWSFTERLHLFGSYGDAGAYAAGPANVETLALRLGVGSHWMIGANTMIAPEIAVVRAEYDIPMGAAGWYSGATARDTGYSAILDLRHRLAPWVEVIGSARYTDVFDNANTQFVAGPVFHLNKYFAIGALYETTEGNAGWELTVRWYY